MTSNNGNDSSTGEAESLRQQGDDAFGTKDWERAVGLYQRSIDRGGNSAQMYGNLAVSFCKLSRFEDASHAAKRATDLGPTWAKAWWRRGMVAELRKFFGEAHKYYTIAVDLDPNEARYGEALKKINKRLDVTETAPDGAPVLGNVNQVRPDERTPSSVAWGRFTERSAHQDSNAYVASLDKVLASQEWLVVGLMDWINGMKEAVAILTLAIIPNARDQYLNILQQNLSTEDQMQQTISLLGGVLGNKQSLQMLTTGFAHLGGLHIPLETGGFGDDGGPELLFCPQPRSLSNYPHFQNLALLRSIADEGGKMIGIFGKKMMTSGAVLAAASMFAANLGARDPIPNRGKSESPEKCVRYIKKKLLEGKRWGDGLRQYVSLHYRGTILYAALIRLLGMYAEAYKWEQWARKFIDVADREFRVTQENTYQEKGSSFQQTFRIGMLISELQSLEVLRGNQINGPYSMEMSLDLCVEIIDRANKMEPVSVPARGTTLTVDEYRSIQSDVASRRKPLALAHAAIASHLNQLQSIFSPQEFNQIAAHHGLIANQQDLTDPFALIAKHYKLAAQAELPDAKDCAVYWWGYASFMARAEANSSFTLGDLRAAISKAEEAEDERDVGLFGINKDRGGTYETIARLAAEHYREMDDSVHPAQVQLVRPSHDKAFLRVDGQVICSDFDAYERLSMERFMNSAREQERDSRLDTSALYREIGPGQDELIPSLETLCIRQLHKDECPYAVGETDGAVIHYKAMKFSEEEAVGNT